MLSNKTMTGLTNNWTVSADPFYVMHKRTGYKLGSILELSSVEAVLSVFGDEVGNRLIRNGELDSITDVQEALFTAWCYMHLRQRRAKLELPIAVDSAFVFPQYGRTELGMQGIDLIRSLCTEDHLGTKEMTEARKMVKDILGSGSKFAESVKALSVKFGLRSEWVRQSVYAACAARVTDVQVLTFVSCGKMLREILDWELPSNLVLVDHNWFSWGNFLWTNEDVAVICDYLAQAVKQGTVEPIALEPRDNGDFAVWVDGCEFVVTPKDGVFETTRNRRFNNMLLISGLTGYAPDRRVEEDDLVLVNSYGTFLYGMLVLGAKTLSAPSMELSQFVSKVLTSGNELPMTSDDEVGAPDADRIYYERYVTVSRVAPANFPFALAKMPNQRLLVRYGCDVTLQGGDEATDEGVVIGGELPAKSAVDRAALMTFNLVRMPRGQFIDGRRSCIQTRHLPAELRVPFVQQLMMDQCNGDLVAAFAYAKENYSIKGVNDKDYWQALSEHLIIGLSSKLAKLIKRTAMDAALVGTMKDGESRGFKRFGQPNVSNNNWLVESVVTPHAIWPAGMAAYWGERPTLVVSHTETTQPNLPRIAELEVAVVPEYSGYTKSVRFGWHVVTYANPVRLDKGDVVARVPFQTQDGEFDHFITTRVPEARLVSIQWRLAVASGNQKQLQVKVTTETHEHEIKGRNNVKCMFARIDESCINNELNGVGAFNARAIFFADTNKWLDLVMQAVDVAACTAVKNADAEGLRLIAEANAAAGASGVELVWSPVLAVLGIYKPLMDWFEAKFGRAVWFRWADASGEWPWVLRKMYSRHNAESEAERGLPVEGWETVSAVDLGVLPAGATNVFAIADGDIENPQTNVLVLYKLDGVEYFVQRAWSFVGTTETGAVWQPVKGELGSVRSIVGQSSLMAGVARAVEGDDPEYARRLVDDGKTGVHKAAVFHAMRHNNTIKAKGGEELPLVKLGSEEAQALLRTDELIELMSDPENAGKLLSLLAPRFKGVMFSVEGAGRPFSVYLPAVYKQDSASEFRSTGSLSDLITGIFVQYILGADITSSAFTQLVGRASGALTKLCEGSGLAKAPSKCRTAVQAKTKAIPGIPVSKVYVRESQRQNSVYQTMLRTYKD